MAVIPLAYSSTSEHKHNSSCPHCNMPLSQIMETVSFMENTKFLVLPLFLVRFYYAGTTFLAVITRQITRRSSRTPLPVMVFPQRSLQRNVQSRPLSSSSSEQDLDFSLVRLDHPLPRHPPRTRPTNRLERACSLGYVQ